MTNQRIQLLPGVYLTVLSTNKFKTNCLSLNLLRPLCREEAAYNALLPDVLLRGCKLCPDMGAVAAWLDERYGAGVQATARKKGEVQAIGFFLDYIDEKYAPGEHLTQDMTKLLGSFLLEPVLENGVFRSDFVAGEKVNLINAIQSQINDKRTYASVRLRQEMFRNERYGVSKYGSGEDVEKITAESLYAHYRHILATSQIEILYTGQMEPEKIQGYLLEALRGLPRGEILTAATEIGPMPEAPREISEVMDVTQGKLVIGFRSGITYQSPEYPAYLMMNGIYGGSLTSKLFMNVRERLSLCYYASSGIDPFKGVMIVSSGVDMDKYETAKAEIFAQLNACRRGEITEEELASTRSYLISSLRAAGDSPYSMEDFYLGQIIGGHDYDPEALAKKLETVTLEQIQKAANDLKLDTIYFLKGEEA